MQEMTYSNQVFSRHKKTILNNQLYHQRFDGCPLFIGYIAEAQARKENRKQNNHFTIQLSFYENERTDWYMHQPDIDRITKNFIEIAQKNPRIGQHLLSEWQKDELEFFDNCLALKKTDLSLLTDEQLKATFETFSEQYLKRLTSSSLIDGFALGSDRIVANMVGEKLAEHKLQNRFTEYFSCLTAPVHLSFINAVEAEILQTALEISKNKPLKTIFEKEPAEQIALQLTRFPKEKEAIQRLCDRYFWSKNNYIHDNILNEKHFIREIKEIFHEKNNLQKQIKKIKETPLQNKRIKLQLFEKLGIGGLLKTLIHLNEDFTFWQDERKKATYWGTHYISVLLAEIGKRTDYSVEELKYFAPCEVIQAFEDKNWKTELQNRMTGCVFLWDNHQFEVLSKDAYQQFKQEFSKTTDYSNVTEFKGLSANLGKVRGPVCLVLSATEVHKTQKGDILVAVMTRPDYIVAMKKAAAIVTNEGGITSHAAIVSRELNIPCVIGTQHATKILSDGDQIEVDADHGTIRILKRAKKSAPEYPSHQSKTLGTSKTEPYG